MTTEKRVRVYEVGPRDGLQNEKTAISTATKIKYIELLAESGLTHIEASSFVKPGAIPQLADAAQVFDGLNRQEGICYSALVPNLKGLEAALAHGVDQVCVFTAASEQFTIRNTNATIAKSLGRIRQIAVELKNTNISLRAYISTVVECPYAGPIEPKEVSDLARELLDIGACQISLGETIGVAVPDEISRLLDALCAQISPTLLAGHFHDTRGTALANVMRSLEYGLRSFDTSSGGLGGCPYAPGAAGNLATEDLVYALERSGYQCGVDLQALTKASQYILQQINRQSLSRVLLASQP